MSILIVEQNEVMTGARVSKCKICNGMGHTASRCDDESIQTLCFEVTDAANYSIAYQPGPVYLNRVLDKMPSKSLHAICVGLRLGSRPDKAAIFNKIYTVSLTKPNALETAKRAIDELNTPGRGLSPIDADLKRAFYYHIIYGQRQSFNDMFTNYYVAPCCPREHALYETKKQEILAEARESRRRLQAANRDVTHRQEQVAEANRVLLAAHAALDRQQAELRQAIYTRNTVRAAYERTNDARRIFDGPRKFAIKTNLIITIDGAAADAGADAGAADGAGAAAGAAAGEPVLTDCPICYESTNTVNMIRTNCGHEFCKQCMTTYFTGVQTTRKTKPCCAYCRAETTTLAFNDQAVMDAFKGQFCTV